MSKVVLYTTWDRIATDIVDTHSRKPTDTIDVRIEDKYMDRVYFFSTLFTKLSITVSSNSTKLNGTEEVFVSKYLENLPKELTDKKFTLIGDDYVTEIYKILLKSELIFSGNTPYINNDLELVDFVVNSVTLTEDLTPDTVIDSLKLNSDMCLFVRQFFNPARVESLTLPPISDHGPDNCIITPVDERDKEFHVVGVNSKEFYDLRENMNKDYYIYRTFEFSKENIENLTKALCAYYFAEDIYC